MNKIVKFIIDYIWQAPLMLLAFVWYLCRKQYITGSFEGDFYKVYLGANMGGLTLGNKIFLSKNYEGERLKLAVAHESGHVKQSLYLGPLYLIVIGLPSLLWAWSHNVVVPFESYYWFYTEKWANKLGGVHVTDKGVLAWNTPKK